MDVRRIDYPDLAQLLALYRHLNPQDIDTDLEAAKSRLELLRAFPGSVSSSAMWAKSWLLPARWWSFLISLAAARPMR